jgi:hypothetical protein
VKASEGEKEDNNNINTMLTALLLVALAGIPCSVASMPSFAFYGDSASRNGRASADLPWPTMQQGVVDVMSMWSPSSSSSGGSARPSTVVVADDPTGTNQPLIVALAANDGMLVGLQQTNGALAQVWTGRALESQVTTDLAVVRSALATAVVIGLQNGQLQSFAPAPTQGLRAAAPVAVSTLASIPEDCFPAGSMAPVNSSVAAQAGLNATSSGSGYLGVAYSCATTGPNIALVDGSSLAAVWQAIPLNATGNPIRSIVSGGVTLGKCGPSAGWCLVVTDSLGGVTALDLLTGNYAWTLQTQNPPFTDLSPAVVDDHTGTLLLSSSSSGATIREVDAVTGANTGTLNIAGGAQYALPPSVAWDSDGRYNTAVLLSDRLTAVSLSQAPAPSSLENLWYVTPGARNSRYVTAALLFGLEAAAAAGQQPGTFGVMALSVWGELTFSSAQAGAQPGGEPAWRVQLTSDRQAHTTNIVNTRALTAMSDCSAVETLPGTCIIVQMSNGSILTVGRVRDAPLPTPAASPTAIPQPSAPPVSQNNDGLVVGLSSAGGIAVVLGFAGLWCFMRRRSLERAKLAPSYEHLTEAPAFQGAVVGDDRAAWE